MDPNAEIRTQIVKSILGEQAHLSFEDAVADFPPDQINTRPTNLPYSFWHLIEHLRITQLDLLEYITHADYKEGTWPDDYWPDLDAKTDVTGWNASIDAFLTDR